MIKSISKCRLFLVIISTRSPTANEAEEEARARRNDHIQWQFTDLVRLVMVFDYFQSNHARYPWEMSVESVLCQKQHSLQAFLHLRAKQKKSIMHTVREELAGQAKLSQVKNPYRIASLYPDE